MAHRLSEEFMPVPGTSLAASGTDLAWQSKEMIKEHVNELMRCGPKDRVVTDDPDAP